MQKDPTIMNRAGIGLLIAGIMTPDFRVSLGLMLTACVIFFISLRRI